MYWLFGYCSLDMGNKGIVINRVDDTHVLNLVQLHTPGINLVDL